MIWFFVIINDIQVFVILFCFILLFRNTHVRFDFYSVFNLCETPTRSWRKTTTLWQLLGDVGESQTNALIIAVLRLTSWVKRRLYNKLLLIYASISFNSICCFNSICYFNSIYNKICFRYDLGANHLVLFIHYL